MSPISDHPMPYHRPLQPDSPISGFENITYYPNWQVYNKLPPSSLSVGSISQIIYAFAGLRPDGSIFFTDEYADLKIEVDGTMGALWAMKKLKIQNPHLRTSLSIGGGGEMSATFPQVAANVNARQNFAQNARRLVDMYDLDGIDIDWEQPADPSQGSNYIQLLKALRNLLPLPYFTLTTALPVDEWALKNIDLYQAAGYVDFINLMTYDFTGPWTETAGHQSQLDLPANPYSGEGPKSCRSAVTYALSRGVPSRKIMIGIPVYGRSFLGATKAGDSYQGQGGQEGTFQYKDLPRPGTKELVDMEVGAAFCVGGDGGFVTYDNPLTVQLKARFVKEQRLGGLFYWAGTGDAEGPRSLVETGYNALRV